MKDYAAIATQHARDVTEGRVVACKWARLACARHLADLERAAQPDCAFEWNPELLSRDGKPYRPADRICLFAELMPHTKGDWAARGEKVRLRNWQVFLLAVAFGWIMKATGKRRFLQMDAFLPRKNGKSLLAAVIGLYCLAVDDEHGAEVYSGATSKDQAMEVFTPARVMALAEAEFRQRFGVVVNASSIVVPSINAVFETIIGNPGDGSSPSCAIVDEYHEHTSDSQYDTMKTGMGARSQPVLLVITTAGTDTSGPCYAHQLELQQILEGVVQNDRRFGIIYTVDKEDDWTSPDALIKANPNFGISINADFMRQQQEEAVRDPRKQGVFQTKHLNIWVNSADPWLNIHAFQAAADKTLREEDFAGEECIEGLDLANVTDIASNCKLFRRTIDGVVHYYYFWRHYLPETVIDDPANRHYQGWKTEGRLIATPGSMIDHEYIRSDINADSERYRVVEVAIDAFGAAGIAAGLERDGFTVVRIPQNWQHLSPPMKWIDGLLKSGRLHHNGDPVALWGVSNVHCKPDRNDNWFPRRPKVTSKIDPAIAMLNATARAMEGAEDDVADQAFVEL